MKFVLLCSATAVGIALTLAADVLLKTSVSGGTRLILAGMALYGLVAIPVAIAFRYSTFGGLFVVWEALYIVLGIFIASFTFHEPLSLRRIIALACILIALLLAYDA
jgi:multidrug transporter EmrE-like cation transporter